NQPPLVRSRGVFGGRHVRPRGLGPRGGGRRGIGGLRLRRRRVEVGRRSRPGRGGRRWGGGASHRVLVGRPRYRGGGVRRRGLGVDRRQQFVDFGASAVGDVASVTQHSQQPGDVVARCRVVAVF